MATSSIVIHVLVPHPRDPARVLVTDGGGGTLPACRPDLGEDDTLVMGLARHLGPDLELHDATVLETYLPPGSESVRDALAILEPPADEWAPPPGLAWATPPDDLPPRLRERAVMWLEEWGGSRPVPDLRARWSRPGWQSRARDWIDDRLASAGRRRTGPVEVRRIWTITALMRVPTDGGVAWFKGVFPLFDREPIVTSLLSDALPHLLPHVLGRDEAEGWLLLDDVSGPPIGMSSDHEAIRAAVAGLVEVQRATIDRHAELAAIGLAHRPLSALAPQVASAISGATELGGRAVPAERVARVTAWVAEQAAWLDGLGFPEVVVHGDFNRANVLVTAAGPVIIDWSDAAFGHPLLDMAVWMVHPGGRFGSDDPSWDAWLEALAAMGDVGPLRGRRDEVFGLGAAFQVVSYAEILRGIEPAMRYQFTDGLDDFWELLDEQVPRD